VSFPDEINSNLLQTSRSFIESFFNTSRLNFKQNSTENVQIPIQTSTPTQAPTSTPTQASTSQISFLEKNKSLVNIQKAKNIFENSIAPNFINKNQTQLTNKILKEFYSRILEDL